jgi:hypothetical protein
VAGVGSYGQRVHINTAKCAYGEIFAFAGPFSCARHGPLVRQRTMAFWSALVKGQDVK